MGYLKVVPLVMFSGFMLAACRGDPSVNRGVSGFQFELVLLHLAALESRLEERLIGGMRELERNVIDACTERLERMLQDQADRLEYAIKQPAVFREGGWVTVQRRFDGSENFERNWTDYRQGFGDARREFWMGLEKLYQMIRTGQHELLVVLEDFDGTVAHAHYGDFQVGGEREKYALKKLGEYTGSAGDSLRVHVHKPFSTYDRNNAALPGANCAVEHAGAWWFLSNGECVFSHLNGKYYKKPLVPFEMGLNWHDFRGDRYSMKSSKMMVRRRNNLPKGN